MLGKGAGSCTVLLSTSYKTIRAMPEVSHQIYAYALHTSTNPNLLANERYQALLCAKQMLPTEDRLVNRTLSCGTHRTMQQEGQTSNTQA